MTAAAKLLWVLILLLAFAYGLGLMGYWHVPGHPPLIHLILVIVVVLVLVNVLSGRGPPGEP